MAPKKYQSGEKDVTGGITRAGDEMVVSSALARTARLPPLTSRCDWDRPLRICLGRLPFKNPADADKFTDGLRKAGLAEQPLPLTIEPARQQDLRKRTRRPTTT